MLIVDQTGIIIDLAEKKSLGIRKLLDINIGDNIFSIELNRAEIYLAEYY